MKSTEIVPFTQWAEINRTDKFFCIQPLSGYRWAFPEDEGYVIYLPPDATDDVLGQAFLEVLGRSRFIWPPDERHFFQAERYVQCYREWERDLVRRYGHRMKRDLYKNMDWYRAGRTEGKISIQPHRRDKPGNWRDLPPDRTVVVPVTIDVTAVGAALRLALDRCE